MNELPVNAPRVALRGSSRRLRRSVAALALLGALWLWAEPSHAETSAPGPSVVDELLRRIDERDKAIAARDAAMDDLAKRVKALERQVDVLRAASTKVSTGAAANDPVEADAREDVIVDLLRRVEVLEQQRTRGFPIQQAGLEDGSDLPSPALIGAVHKVAWPSAPRQPGTRRVADSGASAEPGAIDVDAEAAERALERSLTQSGALLLEPGQMEIEPSFQYLRRDQEGPLVVAVGADTVVGATRLRSNELEGAVDVRIGLPWDSQVEFGVPFRHAEISTVTKSSSSTGSLGFSEVEDDATGFGDVHVGLAKTIVRESGMRPDILARIEWDTDTGQEQNGLSLGTGFDEITGSIIALKRQDPLAFTGKIAYRATLENDNIDPGDELIFSLGANLAASPSTSLSATFDQSFVGEVEFGGQSIAGSEQVISTLTLGVSTVLDRGVLMTFSGGIGLTEDSPDYFVGVSVPISLDIPAP